MIKIPVDFDLSGFTYDPENPTQQSEELCFKLNKILDAMKTEGVEIRAVEAQDVTDAEAYISDLWEDYVTPPQTPPTLETPTNEDMLLDSGIYSAIMKARAAWLSKIADNSIEMSAETLLNEINETLKLQLTQETMLYLSDGTPLYGKTGAIA